MHEPRQTPPRSRFGLVWKCAQHLRHPPLPLPLRQGFNGLCPSARSQRSAKRRLIEQEHTENTETKPFSVRPPRPPVQIFFRACASQSLPATAHLPHEQLAVRCDAAWIGSLI